MDHPEIEPLARICHEVNRAWCEHNGDTSQQPWDEAPDWVRESARQGVLFHLRNDDADDGASHAEWVRHKKADGWTWGPIKDPESKTHPSIVPFDQLTKREQFKDRLFRTVVRAGLGRAIPAQAA